jgi:GWxTD domain-containing protein
MGRFLKQLLLVALAGGVIVVPFSFTKTPQQDQQTSQNPQNGQEKASKNAQKERERKEKDLYKELDSQYKKWLEEDVVYIITPEERSAFLHLSTNEEREQFIEQFWQRRNPDPDSPENTFKEEHYRRIAYANEHYSSGIPGWRTDRGRIYIIWGPPDSSDEHPTGGTYERPADEGGG